MRAQAGRIRPKPLDVAQECVEVGSFGPRLTSTEFGQLWSADVRKVLRNGSEQPSGGRPPSIPTDSEGHHPPAPFVGEIWQWPRGRSPNPNAGGGRDQAISPTTDTRGGQPGGAARRSDAASGGRCCVLSKLSGKLCCGLGCASPVGCPAFSSQAPRLANRTRDAASGKQVGKVGGWLAGCG